MIKVIYKPSDENKKIIKEYINYYKSKHPNNVTTNIKQSLKTLAISLNKKSLNDATENDMIKFFKPYTNPSSRKTKANHIIPFYRWIYKIPSHTKERPPNMLWFVFPSQSEFRRNKDPKLKEKLLIEPEEYTKMLYYEYDKYGQTQAIWETFYLSGARPSELPKMTLKDVEKDENGIVTITLYKSKTQPRQIPLPQTPFKLLEYIENHPRKPNPNSYLWFSLRKPSEDKPILTRTIRHRYKEMINKLNLKPTLKLKSFRKTRATIVFTENKLNDKDIGKIFGWAPTEVIKRREEYELTNIDDLKQKYCKETKSIPSYTQLKKSTEIIDKRQDKEINQLKNRIELQSEEIKESQEKIENLSEMILQIAQSKLDKAIEETIKTMIKEKKPIKELEEYMQFIIPQLKKHSRVQEQS